MQKKILVLVSNPGKTTSLNLPLELKKLQESVQRSQKRDYFTVELRFAASQADLRRHILDIKPSIIHFCGHGTERGLVLEDNTGTAKVVPNEVLTDLLRTFADRIECVLLNACDSENLADDLVQHLNYVIGMNQEVRDDAAIAFAEAFYDALGAGESYERAFDLGKNAVMAKASSSGISRKATVVGEDGSPLKAQNREHLIPVLKINPNPTPMKLLWLSPEVEQQAVRDLLAVIEANFNTIRLFHTDEPIVLKDQYIPVQVTLERRYQHTVETVGGYAESEAELKRIYALKGSSEEEIKRQQVDWEEARRKELRIVVLADPGMGKSTLLRREVGTTIQEVYQALENGKPLQDITLPLFIRLSSLADEIAAIPVGEAILKIIQDRHPNLLKHHKNAEVVAFLNAFLKEQLFGGKALLLLDALDEVPDGNRKKLLEKLNEFAKAYPACPIVGTSRIVGYGGRLVDGAKDMEIVPFNQQQTEQYVETWFRNAPLKDKSVSARGLIQALRERPQIAGLAQNPLLLSLICSLYQRDRLTLPTRRSQIYERAVTYMLGKWSGDNLRQSSNAPQVGTKTELLEEIAYQFSHENAQVFSLRKLQQKIKNYLQRNNATDLAEKANRLIDELSEQDGILQKLNPDENQYLFLHRTFQEYFTASYLNHMIEDDRAEGIKCVRQYFWNYDWHETLTLLAGLMENPMVLIEAIAAEKDDIFQTQLLLAGRCIAECSQISDPLIDTLIDRIYQFWQQYSGAEFIRSVVVAIGQTSTKLVQALQTAFTHENSNVRRNAAEVLEQIGTEKVVEALVLALSDPNLYVRRKAAVALGQVGSEKAVEALVLALSDLESNGSNLESNYTDYSGELDVRTSAAVALEQIGSKKVVEALIQVLSDPKSDVKSRAAWVLGRIGSEKAVEALVPALSDPKVYIRRSAADALGQVRTEKAVEALVLALSDPELDVRRSAADALGQVGSEKAVEALILLALSDPESYVREKAADALGRVGSEKAVEALVLVLSDPISDVKSRAAAALGQVGSEKAVEALVLALSDPELNVRRRAADALVKVGSEKAVEALVLALSDPDSYVKERAADALGRIGSEKAVEALVLALSDPGSYVGSKAAEALGQIGSEKAVEALILVLSDPSSDVKSSAAEALGQVGSEKAVEALVLVLSDPELYVRSNAAAALGRIGSEKAVEALILLVLSDPSSDVKSRAAEALGQVGSEKAVEALVLALSDPSSGVRNSAAWVLGRIGSEKAVEALILLALSDPESYIRSKAAAALGQIGSLASLEKLLQLSNLNIDATTFLLARSWAIRFSKSGSPYIPVYPELLSPPAMTEVAEA